MIEAMSQEESNLEMGSLMNAYLNTKQELACLQGRADRFMDTFGRINGVLQGIQYSAPEMPDMDTYPTREDVQELMNRIPETKSKLADLTAKLRSSGIDLQSS